MTLSQFSKHETSNKSKKQTILIFEYWWKLCFYPTSLKVNFFSGSLYMCLIWIVSCIFSYSLLKQMFCGLIWPYTGWFNWTEISFDLFTLARWHPMKWDRSHFSVDIWTFWYIVSKNFNRFHIFFTDWWVGGLLFWIFKKIHWQAGAELCQAQHSLSLDLDTN